ncbi:unnamed protein product [marine sediment metagenome]|uniref:Glycosyl transferase family 1 domain-containing protein n=1 Tax=marine sediment metagenome TaxID=412755 RepID=X1TH16_9ZZZZ
MEDSDERLVVLFATLLQWHKGLLDLLVVMDSILTQFDRVEFWISGKGDLLDRVQQFATRQPRVRYLGYLHPSDMPELLAQASVVVQPSYYEGFGRTVLEALASGVPVVTTGVGGMDVLEEISAALVIHPGDRLRLRQALERLLTDQTLRRELAVRGRSYVEQYHGWDDYMAKLLQIFVGLIDQSAQHRPA